jgi:hypothetical protein
MLITCFAASGGRACSVHGSIAASDVNNYFAGPSLDPGRAQFWLAIPDQLLVVPTSTAVCAAGVGLMVPEASLPSSVAVLDAAVVLANRSTGERIMMPQFGFAPNPLTSAGLAAGSGPGGLAGTNPLFPGATWFGFSALVEPFTLPPLGDNEVIELSFLVDLPRDQLPLTLRAQFAAGEAQSSGAPQFGGDHPLQYFTATNDRVRLVPEPSAAAVALVALLGPLVLAGKRGTRACRL